MSYIKDGKVVVSSLTNNQMVVYPVTHNLVDLFWGDGWENTARFKWTGRDWALWKKSSSLPKDFIKSLELYRKGE